MSTLMSKRALFTTGAITAGLGASALALMTQRASADTPFSSFSFRANGGTVARTMPDRLADVKNVKEFGAVGDGAADDTAAIQAAINAGSAWGLNNYGAMWGCNIFFPPGVYKVSSALTNNTANSYVRLMGSGQYSCMLVGTFNGYIIDQNDSTAGGINAIEGLHVVNYSTAPGSGAIRFNNSQEGTIRQCYIQGFNGLNASSNTFNTIVSECNFVNPFSAGTPGTVGIYSAQIGIYNCTVMGWDVGLQGFNAGLVIHGSRFEVNSTGILLGKDPTGAINTLSGFSISGLSTERCNTAIDIVSAVAGIISGAALTGTVNVTGIGTPSYGIICRNVEAVTISGVIISCYASVAGIDISSVAGLNVAFEGTMVGIGPGMGLPWNMPTVNHSIFSYTNCNNPSAAFAFSNLPTSPVEGMAFDITDSNTATWGAAAAGGGSNHVRVRYNGLSWTVVGK
jgi:hypothetical protein